MNEKTSIAVDATGVSLGRLASKVAFLLQGKQDPRYSRKDVHPVTVRVEHLQNASVSQKKMLLKKYYRSTGHSGGLKEVTLKRRWDDRPQDLFREIVGRMLPRNKLRKKLMGNLVISL